MFGTGVRGALLISLAATAISLGSAAAAGEKYAVFGGDTTSAERQELAQLFGVAPGAEVQTVTTPEMVQALQNTGLPAAPTDKSISSSVLTCGNKGDGLDVRTQNITRITAPVYANALITAGVGDGNVLIAAPKNNPVTGESALVGVLKSFPQCQAGKPPEASRVRTAFQQIAWTSVLAGPGGDIDKAAAAMLQVQTAVLGGTALDDASAGQALDQAAAAQGLKVPAAQRPQIIQFIRSLAALDFGSYARGYEIQQVNPSEVKVVPVGAGAAAAPAATVVADAAAAVPAASPAPAADAASTAVSTVPATAATAIAAATPVSVGQVYTGSVTQAGQPITVHSADQDRRFSAAPGAIVIRNGRSAVIGDIRPGDHVSVTTNPDGSTRRIDATSTNTGNVWWRWLIPLLLLLALAALLYLLLKQRRDSFVLEPKTTRETGRSFKQ